MSVSESPAYAESIPAVTAPVRLPRLVPQRAWLAGVITGGVLAVATVVLAIVAVVVL